MGGGTEEGRGEAAPGMQIATHMSRQPRGLKGVEEGNVE